MRPRPATILTLGFGAGLATDLAFFGAWGPSLAAAVALAAVGLGGPAAGGALRLAAGALALGLLASVVARGTEATRCAVVLPPGTLRLEVRVLEAADSAGGSLRLQPRGAGCRGALSARWPRAAPVPVGAVARVEASWTRHDPAAPLWGRPGGVLAVRRVESVDPRGAPTPGERLREWIGATARRLYGSRAPVVDALILGRKTSLDPELRERFARAGLAHLLAISGLHVGFLAGWLLLALRAVGLGPSRAAVGAAAGAVAYAGFLGWPAPATRAALLAAVLALSRQRQRHPEGRSVLAAVVLLLLLADPWTVRDLGAWLSVAAVWGVAEATRWSDRALGPAPWWRMLAGSVGATLMTAPVTAAAFGSVSLVGVGLNLVAIPLASVAVPGVALSLLVAPLWESLAQSLAAGAGLALHLVEILADLASRPRLAAIMQPAEPASALPWLALCALAAWGVSGRTTRWEALRRSALGGGLLLWALLALRLAPTPDEGSGLTLHFLDVGQGDAAVIRTPGGRFVLVDAGPRSATFDAGRRVVVPFLARRGARSLAAAVLSHAHADHLGGMLAVADRVRPEVVLDPAALTADPLYGSFLAWLEDAAVPWRPARAGDGFTLDGVRFRVLHPDPAWAEGGFDLNEDSLVLLVEYGDFQALFVGDAGLAAEAHLAGRLPRVDLLKVGHHGSRGATGDAFLAELAPRAGVVSVGRNRYGHPAPEALGRLRARGVSIWRTDSAGTITVTTDGARMQVRGERRGRREEHYPVGDEAGVDHPERAPRER